MTRRSALRAGIAAMLVTVPIVMAGSAGAQESLPRFTQPVVDAAGAVSSRTEAQVGAELTDYQRRTGNQIAVAVVKTTGRQSIEDYGIGLARSWGIGQKKSDNGILLVIATGDRRLRIEVGRGLEGKLTDLQSGRIIRDRLVPLLQRGDVDGAVVQGTRAIRTELGDNAVGALPPAPGARNGSAGPTPLFLLLPAALLGAGALALLRRRGRGGRGSGSGHGSGLGNGLAWGAALTALGGMGGGGFGGGGMGGFGGGGGGFGGGGASGDW